MKYGEPMNPEYLQSIRACLESHRKLLMADVNLAATIAEQTGEPAGPPAELAFEWQHIAALLAEVDRLQAAITVEQIDALLKEIGWEAERKGSDRYTTWDIALQFEGDLPDRRLGEPRLVVLMFPTKRGNLLAVSEILWLDDKSLAIASADTFRTLLRLQSANIGARLEIREDCVFASSIHRGPVITAPLLKMLVLEAALLAERTDGALSNLTEARRHDNSLTT